MLDHKFVDALVDTIIGTLEAKAISLDGTRIDWRSLFEMHRASLKLCESEHELETRINGVLARAGLSHAAFFSDAPKAAPARMAAAVTFREFEVAGQPRWMFQDVHPGGLASKSGVQPGDLLLAVDGSEVKPPIPVTMPMTGEVTFTIVRHDAGRKEVALRFPTPVPNGKPTGTPPMVPPTSVTATHLDADIGYLRVAFFPGASGRPFARDLSDAFRQLGPCRKLVVDLRGNAGGFVGSLRLMSYLTPDRVPVGYSLTKFGQDRGLTRERLMRLRSVPTSRLGEIWMYIRFRYLYKDRSVSLWTEGLGPQPFHGRIAVLINEHTCSAAEMVAAFAYEEGLGRLVGKTTGGQSLGGSNHRVAERYILRLPASVWYTWRGTTYEGRGIPPHHAVEQSPADLHRGRDVQLEEAKRVLRAL